MNIIKIELDKDNLNDFREKLSAVQKAEGDNSVLFTDFLNEHLLNWEDYDRIVLFNIYHTYMGGGTVLYIKHPNQNNLKDLYINILDSLFQDKFGVFGPLDAIYYKLHVNGKAIAIAYHDIKGEVDGSLIFIPNKDLLTEYTANYQDEDDVIRILSELSI